MNTMMICNKAATCEIDCGVKPPHPLQLGCYRECRDGGGVCIPVQEQPADDWLVRPPVEELIAEIERLRARVTELEERE